jgi:predicted nucleotidyltransferase
VRRWPSWAAHVYTPELRDAVRNALLERACEDERVTGAALTGSAALGNEDRWSDIDLFLGVAEGAELDEVVADWTTALYETGAVHHWDVRTGAALYRVFLLESGLQVDVAFTPELDFGARSPSFELAFGEPVDVPPPEPPAFADVAGLGWLGVLHAHKAIERGKPWEATYWIGSVRDQTLGLACLRLGESPHYSRGADRLPTSITAPLEETLVSAPRPGELRRALRAARQCLLEEIGRTDAELADRLEQALLEG